jgi:hydrogenase expression/formation protein HypC
MCLAIPGKILTISGDEPFARCGRVSFGGIVKEVNLAFVPEAKAGDYVVVHVGFAISILDESEAHRVFDYLREIGDLEDLGALQTDGSEASASPANDGRLSTENGGPSGGPHERLSSQSP